MLWNAADLETAARAGLLKPIGSQLPADLTDDLFPFARNLGTLNGELYGLVYSADIEHLASNNATPLPSTWSALLDEPRRYLFVVGNTGNGVSDAVVAHYLSAGGTLTDSNGQPALDEQAVQTLLETYQEAQTKGILPDNLTQFNNASDIWTAWRGNGNTLVNLTASQFLSVETRLPDLQYAALPSLTKAGALPRAGLGLCHCRKRSTPPGRRAASIAASAHPGQCRRMDPGRRHTAGSSRRLDDVGDQRLHRLPARSINAGPDRALRRDHGRRWSALAQSRGRCVGRPRHTRRSRAHRRAGGESRQQVDMPQIDLRAVAHQLQRAALAAVDPAEAVYRFVSRVGDRILIDRQAYALRDFDHIYLVGAGKAAMPMAEAIGEVLHDRLSGGVIITKYQHIDRSLPDQLRVHEAGHPVPDEQAVAATRDLAALLDQVTPRDLVFCVISGGGSALMTLAGGRHHVG